MLIAIMGDAFDRAKENEENNRKLGMLKIMGEYVHLIMQDGDEERFVAKDVGYDEDS